MNSKPETPNSKLTNGQLVRGLGLIAAIAVNVANVIGTGVFLKARVMTCNVGTPGKALTVWLVAGLLSLAGALTYAELLAMFRALPANTASCAMRTDVPGDFSMAGRSLRSRAALQRRRSPLGLR